MIGVIAQELQPLFPDMVSETENPETREKNLSVGYGDFAVIAIKAIQEIKAQQDAEVKDLKAQVAALKAQMKEVLQAAAELRGQADKSKVTASVSK
jgi:type II secretory pathway component PulM